MRHTCWLVLLVWSLPLPIYAQRHYASAEEYEFSQEATQARDPAERIQLLRDWEAAYPSSDFRQERTLMLANAYQSAGRPLEAFTQAAQLLQLDPSGINGCYMVAFVAPSLSDPSADQVKLAEEAARTLLARAPAVSQALMTPVVAPPHPESADATTAVVSDPETERVLALLREWRRHKRVRTAADVESEFKAVAEKALSWAKSWSR